MEDIRSIANLYSFNDIYMYGKYMAKVEPENTFGKGKVILVTATNPTKYGEGKTTVALGLNDAINMLNKKSLASLREPSMGPVFGLKGGATGGGKALMLPENEINLHFTGDMHAITTANNLICSCIDNEIYHDNKLDIQEVTFNRCIDLNDRALRNIKLNNRDDHFDITAASEIMSILVLSKNEDDLKVRLNNIIIGYNSRHTPIHVISLGITDALMAVLSQAMKPNLVQSSGGCGVLVHGGPFANISTGCSSLISLKTATNHAEYVVTEAGFGADAGAFKFIDILARDNKLDMACVVLVTTIRALKHNGDGDLSKGVLNLKAHVNNLKLMNTNVIVTINKFDDDLDDDIMYVMEYTKSLDVEAVVNTVYQDGGFGALDLATKIVSLEDKNRYSQLYDLDDNLYSKIDKYVKEICHADGFDCSFELMNKINKLDALGEYKYPICVAKTQYSLSDNKSLLGYPKNFRMRLTDIKIYNGSKLIVCYFGNIVTMPGLNDNPSVKEIKYNDGEIILPR